VAGESKDRFLLRRQPELIVRLDEIRTDSSRLAQAAAGFFDIAFLQIRDGGLHQDHRTTDRIVFGIDLAYPRHFLANLVLFAGLLQRLYLRPNALRRSRDSAW
jgi:hypothetical protein